MDRFAIQPDFHLDNKFSCYIIGLPYCCALWCRNGPEKGPLAGYLGEKNIVFPFFDARFLVRWPANYGIYQH